MSLPSPEQFGPPSVRLKAFQLWVHGRQFPEAQDRWDGNWLNVTVPCGQSGASAWATGAILDSISLVRSGMNSNSYTRRLRARRFWNRMSPTSGFECARATVPGPCMCGRITPDHLAQRHWFEFEIDLPATIAQLESVLVTFPVKACKMAAVVSLEGPVEIVDGELALLIPLEMGGAVLAPFAGRMGGSDAGFLKVVIHPWLAEKLRIGPGSLVFVDNLDGKFNITRSATNDGPIH